MSRSRAIETRLEKLTPSLDEYFSSGFLTRSEVVEVARQRTHWEYRLVAKPLLLQDVQKAIEYELQLEERLKKFCSASMLTFRHRWTIQERIEGIYRIGLKKLHHPEEREVLRKQCVGFMRTFSRTSALSRLYGEWMIHYPMQYSIWVEAAEWIAIEQGKSADGRALIQQALVTMASEPAVWASAMKIELHMVQHLLQGLVDTHRVEVKRQCRKIEGDKEEHNTSTLKVDQGQFSSPEEASYAYHRIPQQLREENESMGNIVLDLALVKAVVEAALESPACGPTLIHALLATAATYPFSEDIIRLLCGRGVERMRHFLCDGQLSQKQRIMWEKGLGDLLWRRVAVEHFLVYRGGNGDSLSNMVLVNPETYLGKGGVPDKADTQKRLHAAGQTLLTVCELRKELASCRMRLETLSLSAPRNSSTSFCMDRIERRIAEGVCEMLEYAQRFHLLDKATLSSLACLFANFDVQCESCIVFVSDHFLRSVTQGSRKRGTVEGKKRRRGASCAFAVSPLLKEEDVAFLKDFLKELSSMSSSLSGEEQHIHKDGAAPCSSSRGTLPLTKVPSDAGSNSFSSSHSWPIQCFGKFILPKDAETYLTSPSPVAKSGADSKKIDEERIERFLLWWKSVDRVYRPLGKKKAKGGQGVPASSTEERHQAAVQLLQQAKVLTLSSRSRAAEEKEFDVLLPQNMVPYTRGLTPTGLWKVYNVLETMHSESTRIIKGNTEKQTPLRQIPHSCRSSHDTSYSSCSESDEEEITPVATVHTEGSFTSSLMKRRNTSSANQRSNSSNSVIANSSSLLRRISSYATAGIEYLSTICRGSVSSTEEWEVVEGMCTLFHSRFCSLFGPIAFTRSSMQSAIRQQGRGLASAVQGFLDEVKTRCVPTPRYVLVSLVLPFYQAMVLEEPNVATHVAMARRTLEDLLALYKLSSHLNHFAPLQFPGPQCQSGDDKTEKASRLTSQNALVGEMNAKDWMEYIHFERHVAKDLRRGQEIMERARRLCLAPQTLLILNHSSEATRILVT